MNKPIEFQRIDINTTGNCSTIWYRDQYGQPRFIELWGQWTEERAIELLREIERTFL
jgi:hypothetical protein